MESDNSSMDGEVDTHWRESLDTKNKNEEQFSGKGPKSPPENNALEPTSPVSSQGSPRSQSPPAYNSDTKQPHTPGSGTNEKGEQNGDHDADDRLSLSPPPEDRPQSPENRDSCSPSPATNHMENHQSPQDDNTRSQPTSPKSPGSPVNNIHSLDKEEDDEGVDNSPPKVNKSLAEDLSDVSDIESDGGDDDILNAEEEDEEEKDERDRDADGKRGRSKMNGGVTMSLAVTDEEQLDFDEDPTDETNLPGPGTIEREEGEDEDGELAGDKTSSTGGGGGDGADKRGGGGGAPKKEEEELEEGEVSDEGECRPEENEPRPICRFYSRGACTWGSSCRFLHPGVTDKGHYTMFDMIRPLTAPAPSHHAAPYHPGVSLRPADPYGAPAMLDPRVPGAGVGLIRGPPGKEEHGAGVPASVTAGVPATESAWERGLRQAKEILKKSTKRKEPEVDFEEKKMNLTLGQDELDKENDYYTRSASPALSPSPERVLPPPRTKTQGHPPHYLPPGEDYLPPHGHPGSVDPYYRQPIHHVDPYYMHHRPLPPPHHPYDDPHRVYARPRYGAPHPDYYGHPGAPPPREGHLPPHDLVYEPSSRGPPGSKPSSLSSSSRHAKPAREVIVQRVEKSVPHRSGVPEYEGPPSAGGIPGERGPRGGSFERGGMPSRRESPPVRRARADEWADPWMRSKSPGRERDGARGEGGREPGGKSSGKRGRRSSESSYSSSSSRSSSSRSSYSSYSDSRSRSRSPRTAPRSNRAAPPPSRKPPIQFKLSPSSRNKVLPPRGKPASPPSSRMSNKLPKLPFAAASPADNRRGVPGSTHNSTGGSTGGVPPRLLAQAKATVKEALRFSSRRQGSSRSRSSSASSSASSSSSSSSSEEDSSSGDSSSGSVTPPPRGTKKGVPHVSKKAVTAVPSGGGRAKTPLSPPKKKPSSGASTDLNKLAGTKAGIKLNLASDKAGGGGPGKKRPAPDDNSPNKTPPPSKKSSGGVPSRREELLKQLKAVEDAIARKRSKI